jgi:protein-disulfide isomerase
MGRQAAGDRSGVSTDRHRTHKRRFVAAGVALAAAAVVAIAIAASGTDSSSSGAPGVSAALARGGPTSSTIEAAVDALLAGIPQHGSVLGDQAAPVTLQWFGDLQCPFCKEFALGALPAIIKRWVRSGQLRLVYRSMQTATHQATVFKTQQVAALAAGRQQRMWNFLETFYREEGAEDSNYVTESYLQGIAGQIPGLKLAQWMSDRGRPVMAAQLAADRRAVEAAGLRGTPAFLLGRTGTRRVFEVEDVSLTNPTALNHAIEKILKLRISPGASGVRDLRRFRAPPPAAAV